MMHLLFRRCLLENCHRPSKSIVIWASEVPVIARMNPYKNIEDVFYKVWKRTDSNQVEFLKSKLALASSEGYLNHMMVDLGAADVRSRALEMAASADSVNQLKRVHQHTTQEIERLPIRNDTPKKKLIELLTSEANWMYGTANEANAISTMPARKTSRSVTILQKSKRSQLMRKYQRQQSY